MRKNGARSKARMLFWLLGDAALVLCAVLLIGRIDERLQEQELVTLQEQVRRAAVTCYASEGRYPLELGYLEENYGLIYDHARYSILYDAFASNVMPDIEVTVRGDNRP